MVKGLLVHGMEVYTQIKSVNETFELMNGIACFNIKSGDIEDAPALNALNKYDLIEKDDGVYVNATESDIKASQRNPVQKCTISSQEEVLVVGGYVTHLTTNTTTLQEEMNN